MHNDKLPGSHGEHKMQEEFNTQEKAKDFYNRQMRDYIAPEMQAFIAKQEMVFIATSDSNGECDNSFRSGEAGFVTVLDEKHLVYPDFKGNGVLASVGNISENPHVGMLFIDFFENKVGLHVNGKAKKLSTQELTSFINEIGTDTPLPICKQIVSFWTLVTVEEAYIHCSRNIPILKKCEDKTQQEKSRPVDFFNLS